LLGWKTCLGALEAALDQVARSPVNMEDFVSNRRQILSFSTGLNTTFEYHWNLFGKKFLRCRGPRGVNNQYELHFALYDAANQLYYAKDIFCPACIGQRHDANCPIEETFTQILERPHDGAL